MFMVLSSLRDFARFIWWVQTQRHVAANPQTKPIDLDCELSPVIIITPPNADTHLTVPWSEGWVDL